MERQRTVSRELGQTNRRVVGRIRANEPILPFETICCLAVVHVELPNSLAHIVLHFRSSLCLLISKHIDLVCVIISFSVHFTSGNIHIVVMG